MKEVAKAQLVTFHREFLYVGGGRHQGRDFVLNKSDLSEPSENVYTEKFHKQFPEAHPWLPTRNPTLEPLF